MPVLRHPALLLSLALGLSILAACDGGAGGPGRQASAPSPPAPPRSMSNPATLALGEQVYRDNCAACHGAAAEGAADWRHRDPRGLFPPPPLNGSGHMWHHPMADLVQVINEGSPPGQGRMPAWKQRLDQSQVAAVILWLQSRWPDEVYAAWARIDREARGE